MWCTEITGDGRKGEEAPEHVISLEAITVRLNMKGGSSAELNLMVKVFVFTSRKSSVDISVCKSVLVFCRIHAW
jgi:hypothetical protein